MVEEHEGVRLLYNIQKQAFGKLSSNRVMEFLLSITVKIIETAIFFLEDTASVNLKIHMRKIKGWPGTQI